MQILGVGKSSFVFRDSDSSSTVTKQIFPGFDAELKLEHHIYEWLGPHPQIAEFHGPADQGIELEYYPRGSIFDLRKTHPEMPEMPYLKWSKQIAQGLEYLHSKGIIHCDLRSANILITDAEDVVLSDFGSSMIDGLKVSGITNRHRYRPANFDEPGYSISIQDDLFAFGSVAYNLATSKEPYEEKTDEEVVELYASGTFPDVSQLCMGDVISKCWLGKYSSAAEVLADICQYIP